jgi:hypothetical protein
LAVGDEGNYQAVGMECGAQAVDVLRKGEHGEREGGEFEACRWDALLLLGELDCAREAVAERRCTGSILPRRRRCELRRIGGERWPPRVDGGRKGVAHGGGERAEPPLAGLAQAVRDEDRHAGVLGAGRKWLVETVGPAAGRSRASCTCERKPTVLRKAVKGVASPARMSESASRASRIFCTGM